MSLGIIEYTCKLGTTDISILDDSLQITYELNQVASFEVKFANYTIVSETLTLDNRTIIANNISEKIHFYKGISEIFTGRIDVDTIEYTQEYIKVSGYASYIDLIFEFFSKDQSGDPDLHQYDIRRVQYDNTAANTVLSDVLSGAGYTVSECPTTLISIRGEHETRLQWISAIAKACKYVSGGKTYSCDWWIDSSDGVHIAQTKGSNKGTLNWLAFLDRELDYANIQNTAYGLGYGDGINQLKSTKTNSDSVTTYGTREVVMTDRRFQNQDSLDGETQEYADMHADPTELVRCEIYSSAWYDDSLEIGDTVTIPDNTETGITGSYRIKKAIIGHKKTELNITNIVPRLSSEIQAIKRQLYVDGSYMQGQTVPLNFSNMDNVDDGYPLKLNIHIPSKTKAINSFYLSFDIELFRGWVGVTESEADHTHEFKVRTYNYDESTDGNIYLSGMFDDLSIPAVKLGTNGQDTVLKGETSESGEAHTHDISYGISEDIDNSPSISIKINGTDRTAALGGPWTTDQLELDLTTYIQSTGKHTIELLSSARARIQADAWGQVFIQSD